MGTMTKLYLKSILTSVSGHERDARASGGQPVIYLNNKEYVKINGQFVEYEAGKLGGTSSFFPENWSDIKIKEEVEFAIANNHGKVNPTNPTDNLHFGFSKDGTIEIQFYYNADGSIGSYFPKKR
jgi:Bacterial EndoU nuclease